MRSVSGLEGGAVTDDEGFQPYKLPDNETHPATIAARLMLTDEHKHLVDNEIVIEYLMACSEKVKGGKAILAAVHLPTVQGRLKDLFEMLLARFFGALPDFLMVIDEGWWLEAAPVDREALVWHELCHVQQEIGRDGELKFDQDGNPKYGLREHDVSAFNSEVVRYGAWSSDLQQFLAAANQNNTHN